MELFVAQLEAEGYRIIWLYETHALVEYGTRRMRIWPEGV